MPRIALTFILMAVLAGCAALPPAGSPRPAAEAAYAAGDYGAAASAYEAITAADGSNAEDWFRLGNAYVELGRPVDASLAFRTALARDPGHQRARHNLGVVYLQLGVTSVLEARRGLPAVDAAAAATMRYLACLMETFMGQPDPVTCRDPAAADAAAEEAISPAPGPAR